MLEKRKKKKTNLNKIRKNASINQWKKQATRFRRGNKPGFS